jgi:hypothetical protein
MANQALLKSVAECEYPEEFLMSRLLGKMGKQPHNWDALLASSDAVESMRNMPCYPYLKKYSVPGIWHFLRDEYLWVYKRMNNRLRQHFEHYFAYNEINNLHMCLRFLWHGEVPEHIRQELSQSLLHEDILALLRGKKGFSEILNAIETRLCAYAKQFAGLGVCYEKKGVSGLESYLRESLFTFICVQRQPPILQFFFRALIDFYNCMSVAKSMRWEINTVPSIIPGGTVPIARFKRACLRKDLLPVLRLLHLPDPERSISDLARLEISLLHTISFKLKTWSYQRDVDAVILFYLWEQYRYTRNISVILITAPLSQESVRENIVA